MSSLNVESTMPTTSSSNLIIDMDTTIPTTTTNTKEKFPLAKNIFLDGLTHMGLLKFLKRFENVHLYNDVKHENSSESLKTFRQNLHTLTIVNKMQQQQNNRLFERSPLSQLYFSLIFDSIENFDEKNIIDCIKEIPTEIFAQFPSVIVIPNKYNLKDIIWKMMQLQEIDLISAVKYVKTQFKFFTLLSKYNLFNKYVFLPHYPQMYDKAYFSDLYVRIERAIQILNDNDDDKSKIIIPGNNSCWKAYKSDAGFDLCLKHDTFCPAGKATKIELIERVNIPIGFYGQIIARSSTNAIGTIRTGIVDATYNGPLIIYFISDENILLEKYRKIAQLIICPLVNASIERNITSLKRSGVIRKSNNFGSSGKYKIPAAQFLGGRQYCAQPQTDIDIAEFNQCFKNLVYSDSSDSE